MAGRRSTLFSAGDLYRLPDNGWFHEGPPDLAAEVLSPGNRRADNAA